MHYHYYALCDSHKVRHELVVVNNSHNVYDVSKAYVDQKLLGQFLIDHHGCELRLAWRDDQWEADDGRYFTYHAVNQKHCFCEACKKER